jgi:hypothetical protein
MTTEIKTATDAFQMVIGDPNAGNVPAVLESHDISSANAGGISYKTATDAEKQIMDTVIASIDLTNSDTIIALGEHERQELARLADAILDSINPSIKVKFTEVMGELIDAVRTNNLSEIKKRISLNPITLITNKLTSVFSGKDSKVENTKEMISNFMTEVGESRKIISEMVDKLEEQKDVLDQNFEHINELGAALTVTAANMGIIRAGVAEYIRRVNDGEITTLTDLQEKAANSKRASDRDNYQLAEANWNNLLTVDTDLLGSISVYDMNIANLVFTRRANVQNRIQTRTALTTTIAEWKTQLAIFATVTAEQGAAQLLKSAADLQSHAIKQNVDLFDTLVDSVTKRSAQGTFNLREIITAQDSMATKLEGAGKLVEEAFKRQEEDKKALAVSAEKFRVRATNALAVKSPNVKPQTPQTPNL